MILRFLRSLPTVLACIAALLWHDHAAGQTPDCPIPAAVRCRVSSGPAILGDFNNDGKVITNDAPILADDLFVFDECLLDQPLCPLSTFANIVGDFNFDGVVDCTDREFLLELGRLADPVTADGRLSKVVLAEIRTGKPANQTAPTVAPSRYVEFYSLKPNAPATDAASGDPSLTLYREGWYYLKICRSTPNIRNGTIAAVYDLAGMPVLSNEPADPGLSLSKGRSVLADDSFFEGAQPMVAAVPASLRPWVLRLPSTDSLELPRNVTGPSGTRELPREDDTNLVHLLVYRDPSPTNPRPIPTPGAFVNLDTGNVCSSLNFYQGPGAPPPAACPDPDLPPAVGSALIPWNVVVDAVSLLRSGGSVALFGCNYSDTPATSNSIGPVGVPPAQAAPLHPFRCFNDNRLIKGPEAVTVYPVSVGVSDSDTPFYRNAICTPEPPPDCGEPNSGSCFVPHATPFCSDPDCCLNVCITGDPSCCEVEWDANCVTLAGTLCRTCDNSTASCYIPHPTPSCEDDACCDRVCDERPDCCVIQWDVGCAAIARQNCLLCGGPTTGPCDQPSDLPSCSDKECCNTVCSIDPRCCDVAWDQRCVDIAELACTGCGGILSGPCCIIHPGPYCENAACCVAVCSVDPSCCTETWDLTCTQIAAFLPDCDDQGCVCGTPADPSQPFDCFVAHSLPGCEDSFCCQSVCVLDEYCCRVSWDEACVRVTENTCTNNPGCFNPTTGLPAGGSCFVPHANPGCDRSGCCGQVCNEPGFDYCCQVSWDADCVVLAIDICNECGDPFAGSCFIAHASPNCLDAVCCDRVCNSDPFCCEQVWDSLCVTTAETLCSSSNCGSTPDRPNRSCWVPSYVPGCTDTDCCSLVCSIDPFCCESRWDAVCARQATFMCEGMRGFVWDVGTEGCLDVHASPGCSNRDCSRAVCSVKQECCTVAWDADCVLATYAVCPNPESCPAAGDCMASHVNPGCQDPACCNGVCAIDPACCDTTWDANCANTARDVCEPRPGQPCPCLGDCFETHVNPGCNDKSCCSVVCNINPACCESGQQWDADCVELAREQCCGEPGCGSGCNGPCLVAHAEPYCDDPYCCEAVCQADPLCCNDGWDETCVGIALLRCASACGIAPAGDCFVPHDLPSCDQGKCCVAVCQSDPFCCQAGWDGLCVDLADQQPDNVCRKLACGDLDAGSPCEAHESPASSNEDCCQLVEAEDPYCVEVEWDVTCVEIARGFAECGCGGSCGDTCAGSCCEEHDGPSCDDRDCCKQVCATDSYCCEVVWDAVCADTARDVCGITAGPCAIGTCGPLGGSDSGNAKCPSGLGSGQNCCDVGSLPFCSNRACCCAVCSFDAFCCEVRWDNNCVIAARDVSDCNCSDLFCGSPSADDCFAVHSAPFCSGLECCIAVCEFNPLCCSVEWDQSCVEGAEFACVNFAPPKARTPATAPRAPLPRPGWIPERERYKSRSITPLKPTPGARPASPGREDSAVEHAPGAATGKVPASSAAGPVKPGKPASAPK